MQRLWIPTTAIIRLTITFLLRALSLHQHLASEALVLCHHWSCSILVAMPNILANQRHHPYSSIKKLTV